MLFCYSVDALSKKPSNPSPYQRKENYRQDDLSIEDIARLCGTGHCWRAGIYDLNNGTFKKKDAQAAQLLALDFDKVETSPYEVIEYAANVGLPISFWYPSFSMNPETLNKEANSADCTCVLISNLLSRQVQNGDFGSKNGVYKDGWNYRIVWCLKRQISPREYECVYRALLGLFGKFGPDKATKDCSRLWYGGKLGYEVISQEPLDTALIGRMMALDKVSSGTEPNKAMRQKKNFIPEYADMPTPDAVLVNEGWYNKLQGRCKLWDRWTRGDYLDYNERLALFSNLRFLRYSDKNRFVVQDVLKFFVPKAYEGHTCDEAQIRQKFRDSSLKPCPIVKGLLGVPQTVPEFLSQNVNVPIVPNLSKVPLENLDRWMDEHVSQFLDDRVAGIKILKSQTASGKTERIINYLLRNVDLEKNKVIYAAPKHSNLEEVETRLFGKATFNQKALIHRCPQKEVTQSDLLYLQLGLPAKTRSAKRKGFIDKLFSPEEKGLFLLTHSLLTNLSNLNADLIIVDEEIDSSLIKETKLGLTNLATTIPFLDLQTSQELTQFINDVRNKKRDEGLDIDLTILRERVAPQIEAKLDSYIQSTQTSSIAVGLFECYKTDGRLSKDNAGNNCVRMVRKSTLIGDAKMNGIPVRVFTATPLSKRTEMYYRLEIELIEAPLAENKGKIVQFCGLSGARGMHNDNFPKLAQYIKEKLPQEVIDKSILITFKGSKEEVDFWQSQGFNVAENKGNQIHLLNNSGLDCFKGKSLIIAGKSDLPQQAYQDYYDDCHESPQELTRQNQVIELNGVRQSLYLFVDEEMQKLQLQNIQAAAEQAAGRARALREEGATVYLFSNLVIRDADEVIDR